VAEALGELDEQVDGDVYLIGAALVEDDAVDELHDDLYFDEFEEPSNAPEAERTSQGGVVESTGDYMFVDGLIEESRVFVFRADDAFEGEDLPRGLVDDLKNLRSCPLAEPFEDVIA